MCTETRPPGSQGERPEEKADPLHLDLGLSALRIVRKNTSVFFCYGFFVFVSGFVMATDAVMIMK